MNSQQLLLINFIIILCLALYFILGRSKQKNKTTLDLKKKSEAPLPIAEHLDISPLIQDKLQTQSQPVAFEVKDVETQIISKKEIVFFIYNGHEWEAHEVLGLESGVSLEIATQHYQNLIKTADPSTFEFYEAAFSAILKLKSSKW